MPSLIRCTPQRGMAKGGSQRSRLSFFSISPVPKSFRPMARVRARTDLS